MKEKIRQLIQQNRTREALELLVPSIPEANVNLSKLTNMERRSRAGAMDFDDYSKNLSEINLNILDMLDQLPDPPKEAVQPVVQAAPPPPAPVAASTPAPAAASAPAVTTGFRTIRIFLASSSELRTDRDAFELYFRQLNDDLPQEKGIYLKIVRWENFLDAMSETRLQDEYNLAIRNCDIFLSLFFTKTGKYTEEEFDAAHQLFQGAGKPLIFTFFKNASLNTGEISNDILTLLNFKKKLSDLGHYYTSYDNIEHLKRQFRDQLDKMLREGKV